MANASLPGGPTPEPGGQLGDFRIYREVGRGGMGVVYEAEQISLRRRVALKVLPFAALLDPRQLARFKNEAQAAACVQHTHIVPVYFVGCERGVHYYAMQYVEGQSLAEVIRHLGQEEKPSRIGAAKAHKPVSTGGAPATETFAPRSPQTPEPGETSRRAAAEDGSMCAVAAFSTQRSSRRREYFRSVARLGVEAAEALDHAHKHGVVHRDIKPANLLLDISGSLWITDFGLARFENDASLTMSGELVGTLRYMSPEQALAKRVVVDYRTDIYSLGVTLYELLSLEPAYTGRDRQELFKQIAFDDPRRLRSLDRAIPKEMETVVQKAMEKRAEDRYATAQDLADDLRRFLQDQPVRARPPTLAERVGKWSRRHKGLVASAVSIAATLLVATTVVTLTVAAHQRQDVQRRLAVQKKINHALAEATRLRGQGSGTVDGSGTGLALAREQLQWAVALAESGPADPELLDQVRQFQAELDQEHTDRQLLAALDRAWLAGAEMDFVQSQFSLGTTIALSREALKAYGLTVGKGLPEETAAAIRTKPDAVRRELLAALDLWRLSAPPSVGIVFSIVEGKAVVESVVPNSPAARDGRLKKGDHLVGVGQGREGPLSPTGKMTSPEVRNLVMGESGTIVRLQVLPQGQSERRIYEIQRDATAAWLKAVLKAADNDPWRRRLREAFDLRDPAQQRATLEKLAEEADIEHQPGRLLTTLALLLHSLGANDRAIALLEEVWPKHPRDVLVSIILGVKLQHCSPPRLDEAARYSTAAVALRPDAVGVHMLLGSVLLGQKKLDGSAAEFREAVRLKPDYAAAHGALGYVLGSQAKLEEAVAEWREAIRLKPDYASEAVAALSTEFKTGGLPKDSLLLAVAYWQLGKKEEARRWYDKAAEWMEKAQPKDAVLLRLRAEAGAMLGLSSRPAVAKERPEATKTKPPAAAKNAREGAWLEKRDRSNY